MHTSECTEKEHNRARARARTTALTGLSVNAPELRTNQNKAGINREGKKNMRNERNEIEDEKTRN